MTSPPAWLIQFANQVAARIKGFDILAPLGCHYYHNRARDQWELTIFASNTETVGGPFDGKLTASKFYVDILGLLQFFNTVDGCHWQALKVGPDDDLGPHLSVEGETDGQSVWLRVLAAAPERFQAGRYFNTYDLRLVEEW